MKKRKIKKFGWYILSLILFIEGIIQVLEIDRPSKVYGTEIKADFEEGVYYLLASTIIFLIVYYFFETKEEKVFICKNCEEAYSEKRSQEIDSCSLCGGELVDLNGFYEKSNKS
jgi:hypothetical protein